MILYAMEYHSDANTLVKYCILRRKQQPDIQLLRFADPELSSKAYVTLHLQEQAQLLMCIYRHTRACGIGAITLERCMLWSNENQLNRCC
jgi:hypothetical protein